MKILITDWQGRISPVFDSAGYFLNVEAQRQEIIRTEMIAIPNDNLDDRIDTIKRIRPDLIICGAISLYYEQRIIGMGVNLIPRICGPTDKVIEAYLLDQLTELKFSMPGCRGKGFRRRGRGRGRGGNGNFNKPRR